MLRGLITIEMLRNIIAMIMIARGGGDKYWDIREYQNYQRMKLILENKEYWMMSF